MVQIEEWKKCNKDSSAIYSSEQTVVHFSASVVCMWLPIMMGIENANKCIDPDRVEHAIIEASRDSAKRILKLCFDEFPGKGGIEWLL